MADTGVSKATHANTLLGAAAADAGTGSTGGAASGVVPTLSTVERRGAAAACPVAPSAVVVAPVGVAAVTALAPAEVRAAAPPANALSGLQHPSHVAPPTTLRDMTNSKSASPWPYLSALLARAACCAALTATLCGRVSLAAGCHHCAARRLPPELSKTRVGPLSPSLLTQLKRWTCVALQQVVDPCWAASSS